MARHRRRPPRRLWPRGQLKLKVDGAGRLALTKTYETPRDQRISRPKHGENVLAGMDGLSGYARQIEDCYQRVAFEDRIVDSIIAGLSDADAWVFPGGRALMFQDAAFSKNQDLVAHLTYVDVS